MAKILFAFYLIWILLHLFTSLTSMSQTLSYSGWGISDLLINYQAGFVRRGLLGEVLYQIYQICPFDVSHLLLFLIILSAILCVSLLYFICRRLCYSPVLLFSGFTLQFLALVEVVGVRRDYLTLLFTFIVFWTYRRWILSSCTNWIWSFLCQLLIIVTVLLHEGAWFYTFPILCLHLFFWSVCHANEAVTRAISRCKLFSIPVFLVMIALFIHKGSNEIANGIWSSWTPLFNHYPLMGNGTPEIDLSVQCLSSSTMDFVNGCGLSCWWLTYGGWLPMFPLTIALFPTIIYLVSRANTSCIGIGYSLSPVNRVLLTAILIEQLLFMLPYFLFLSCDYGRLLCYWIMSSIFAFYIFQNDVDCCPRFIHRLSEHFQNLIAKVRVFTPPLGYVLILVLTPCNMVGGAALGAIPLYRMIRETPMLLKEMFNAVTYLTAFFYV